LTTAALFKNLKEYELEINRLNEHESDERKAKGIILKTDIQKEENNRDYSS